MFAGEDNKDEVGRGDKDGSRSGGEIATRLKECNITQDNILALMWKIDPIAFCVHK